MNLAVSELSPCFFAKQNKTKRVKVNKVHTGRQTIQNVIISYFMLFSRMALKTESIFFVTGVRAMLPFGRR